MSAQGWPRGDGALWLLLRLQFRGAVRRQLRRLKEPKGLLLALVGLSIFGLWLSSVLLSAGHFGGERARTWANHADLAALGAAVFLLGSFLGGLSHPGVQLPPAQVDRYLSLPVTRGAILRHRLLVLWLRILPAMVLFALLGSRNFEDWRASVLGFVLFAALLAVVQQTGSFFAAWVRGGPWRKRAAWTAAAFGVGALVASAAKAAQSWRTLAFWDRLVESPPYSWLREIGRPVIDVVLAEDVADVWPVAFGIAALVLAGAAFLGILRLDWRESALASAQRLEERLGRLRAGKLWGQTVRNSNRGALVRAPFWLGRGPLGAVVWAKTTGVLRRSPGNFAAIFGVLAGVVLLTVFAGRRGDESAFTAALMIAIVGGLYLSSALRADLREEVDRLEFWRALPLSARRTFFALVLPHWAIVSALLWLAIGLRVAPVEGGLGDALWVLLFIPPTLFLWAALDNAFFVFWPVRMLPGPTGSLQHVGRSVLALLLRGGAFLVAGGLASLAYFGSGAAVDHLEAEHLRAWIRPLAALVTLLPLAAFALWLGGVALSRYDPSQDRVDGG